MTASHETTRRRDPRGRGRRAFTLVELLVVMFIMSVVAALIVGVSWYVIEQGRKTQTATNQKKLIEAVLAYKKVMGHVPDVSYDPTSYTSVSKHRYKTPDEEMPGLLMVLNDSSSTTNLTANNDSAIARATRPFLGPDGGSSLTTDAYGNSMIYIKDGGVGGGPVIISGGPDGITGYEGAVDTVQYAKDNIRSDSSY